MFAYYRNSAQRLHQPIVFIAINLYMSVVHGRSTIGFAKWYLTASAVIATCFSVAPSSAGVWSFNPTTRRCNLSLDGWYLAEAWQLDATRACGFLTAAAAGIALFCVASVLLHLLLARIRVRAATSLKKANGLETVTTGADLDEYSVARVALRLIPYPLVLGKCITLHVHWAPMTCFDVYSPLEQYERMGCDDLDRDEFDPFFVRPVLDVGAHTIHASLTFDRCVCSRVSGLRCWMYHQAHPFLHSPSFPAAIRVAVFGAKSRTSVPSIITFGSGSPYDSKLGMSSFPASPHTIEDPFYCQQLDHVLRTPHASIYVSKREPASVFGTSISTLPAEPSPLSIMTTSTASSSTPVSESRSSLLLPLSPTYDGFNASPYAHGTRSRSMSTATVHFLPFELPSDSPILPLPGLAFSPSKRSLFRGSRLSMRPESGFFHPHGMPASPTSFRIRSRAGTVTSVDMNQL
jgi:hypothetical protein